MIRRPELQVVSLSFLDLLCCAFGAVILLVLLLIPGAGRDDVKDLEWQRIDSRILPLHAKLESVRIKLSDNIEAAASPGSGTIAEPLPMIQRFQDNLRFQFIPIFKDVGVDTELKQIRCEAYFRGPETPSLDKLWIAVFIGEKQETPQPFVRLAKE